MSDVVIEVRGTFRLSDQQRRTSGYFNQIMARNEPTFTKYFERRMFHGSLNLQVDEPGDLIGEIHAAGLLPDVTIPIHELDIPQKGIGDHMFWLVQFTAGKIPPAVPCWLMRKVGTGLDKDHHEVLSPEPLRDTYGLVNGDHFVMKVG
ncbi:MAG: hypothetical protein ACN0LA_13490 [Candidatus Longimicrobiales bacterium M2_2A_002]